MARYLLLVFALMSAGLAGALCVLNGRDAVAAASRALDRQLARAGKTLAVAEEKRFDDLRGVAERAAGFEPLQTALGERVARGEAPDQAILNAASGALAVNTTLGGKDRSTLLVVVTERGFAESRLGETSRFGDGPRVVMASAAVAGQVGHGFSVIDERLYRVVAVPVGPGQKPLGALVLGFPVDDPFAASLEEAAGAEVTVLRAGSVVASTLPPAERSQVAPAASANGMLPFGFGLAPDDVTRVFGLVPAPFLLHGAGALRASPEPLPGVEGGAIVLSLDALPALRPAVEQGARLAALAALLLVIGIALFATARATPGLSGLADSAEALAAGELRPPPEGLSGNAARIARALGRLGPAAAPELFLPTPPIPGPAAIEAAAAVPGPASEQMPDPATSDHTDPFGGRASRPPLEKTVIAPVQAPLAPTQPRPIATAEDWPSALAGLPEPPSVRDMPFATPPPYDPFSALPPHAADAGSDRTEVADPMMGVPPEQTVVAAVPAALLRATSRAPEVDPEETHFQEVFREFLEVRRRCGEGVDGVTFDRFAAKLRKNREQLVEKYRCRTVRFTVYVKDGKTALKATPVKE